MGGPFLCALAASMALCTAKVSVGYSVLVQAQMTDFVKVTED